MVADNQTITLLHYISPIITLLSSTLLATPNSGKKKKPELPEIRQIVFEKVKARRGLITALITSLLFTFLADGADFAVNTVLTRKWEDKDSLGWVVYDLGNLLVWALVGGWTISQDKFLHPGLAAIAGCAFVQESVLLGFESKQVSNQSHPSIYTVLHLVILGIQVLALPILFWAISSPIVSYEPVSDASDERDTLLSAGGEPNAGPSNPASRAIGGVYGTFGEQNGNEATTTNNSSTVKLTGNGTEEGSGPQRASGAQGKKADADPKGPPPPSELTWSEWFARFRRLAPFLWPSKSGKLQLLAISCLFILVLGRGVNVLVPQLLGKVVAALTSQQQHGSKRISPWPPLAVYVALRFCQGNGGILAVSQNLLWAPVMQYSDREMSMMTFNHLLDLSLAFHTKRKTGEVLRILDRGSAINSIFQLLIMNVAPVLFDIAIAIIYFFAAYGWALALVVFVVMFSYVAVSITLTTWRTKLRRQMVERDVINRGIHTDVLMNWESVKYFTSEERESKRYREALDAYQVVEFKVISSLNLLNFVQNAIITSGLLVGSLIIAYNVTQGKANAGEFVVFLVYLGQLYGPLNSLGMLYRSLNSGLIDAEKLLKLLAEEREITDKPDAKDLVITDGVIEFRDVHFGYSKEVEAISGINFKVEKGESVALVGESGSGKSSLLRLLYRFYDVSSGEILIDGQNIKDVTQKSLRRAIGIVPQDSVLWNDTIEFNIAYGREGATREEVEKAAKAARLHDRIMEFPEQYDTVVGERGIRLSGGEKQRVSLARTILKAPAILVLDEATSALDTENERFVQQSLNELAKGRSSLMIAHRLSTIVSAHKIIVLRGGKIIEMGSHKDLLTKENGVFAGMWRQQITSDINEQTITEVEEHEGQGQLAIMVPDAAFDPSVQKSPTPSAKSTTKRSAVHQQPSSIADDGASGASPFVVDAERSFAADSTAEMAQAGVQSNEYEAVPPISTKDAEQNSVTQVGTSNPFETPEQPSTSLPETESPGVSFPSVDDDRPHLTHSISQSSDVASSTTSQSPTLNRSNSQGGSASIDSSGKKDKRKKMGSIGGLVRRVSEQGKNLVKSPSRSPVAETPGTESPFVEGSKTGRQKRFSMKTKGNNQ